ncbi:MAG TPA: hypothetical protein VMH28_25910 [Candidatus Acidoferrales bacterium]|nr:hypothetical protein [Candidatus Acidoferrales bacterium]
MNRAFVICILAALAAPAADTDAPAILAKAVAAFERNLANEKFWNWTSTETRIITDRSGKNLQKLPAVRSESVILGDGRRCNAVVSWGDGHAPYLKDAAPEDRCQAYTAIGTPFQVALLLKSATAKVTGRSADTITLSVLPDKLRQKDPEYGVRCAASIEGAVELDAATFFPLRIEGRVVDSGCNSNFVPVMHDTPLTHAPMSSNFRKGAHFLVVYSLQKDRFDNPAHSFWISTGQRYDQPLSQDVGVLYYWGRQFPVRTTAARRLIKDVATTAQEFGAGSQLTFK